MFCKKYKIKTSTALKGSERKKFRNSIRSSFSCLSDDDLNDLLPPKGELTQVKAFTHSEETVMIFYRDNNPLFFSLRNQIFPTVYTLWKFPNIVPTVTTLPIVLQKMCNGADLMAPGVVVDEKNVEELKDLQPNQVCSVRIIGNKIPIAIGTAAMSGSVMVVDGCKGKAVLIKHCYRDNLWSNGDLSHPPLVPDDCLTDSECLLDSEINECNDNIVQTSDNNDVDEVICENLSDLQIDSNKNSNAAEIDSAISNSTLPENQGNVDCDACNTPNIDNIESDYTMDDILKECFMLGLKIHGKKIQLPVLTSTFYRTYVLSCCPEDLKLDIKKTSYKKLSAFLKEMKSEHLLDVKELTKGVESIVAINLENEKVKSFSPDPRFKEHVKRQKEISSSEDASKDTVQDNYKFPEIIEMFVVSGQVKALFEHANKKKGDALVSNEIREIIRDYVRQNNLIDEKNPRLVMLDPILADVLLKRGENKVAMTWEEVHEILIQKMSPAHKVTFEGEEAKVTKGHLEPIEVAVATRTGNKKVTLISNLESFGIKPEKLANYVQVAVAASTSVGQASSGKKGTQVLIQGNQLRFLQKLFFEIYKVPRKYVKGLDSIPSKKKK